MTLDSDFWNTIAIVITLNTLYNDFDKTIASLFESRERIIDQI